MTDGLRVHSENWQALDLLLGKYRQRINAVYIDPPYNSLATEILYNNDHKNSSWLSLMANRISVTTFFLTCDAPYVTAINSYAQHHLSELLTSLMPEYERYMIIVNRHPQGGMSPNVSRTHEYMILWVPSSSDVLRGKEKSGEVEHRSFMLSGPGEAKSRLGRPNSLYALLVDPTTNQLVGLEPSPPLGVEYP